MNPVNIVVVGFLLTASHLHGAPAVSGDQPVLETKDETWKQNLTNEDVVIIQHLKSGTWKPDPGSRHEMSPRGFEILFRDVKLLESITLKELILDNIKVEGQVDLSNAKVAVPVLMRRCDLPGGLKIRSANLVGLVMENCKLGFVEGDGVVISNDLVVGPETKVSAEFRLPHARIGGGISIREGSEISDGPLRDCSINLWDAEVNGQFHIGGRGVKTKLSGCIVLNGSLLGKMKIENAILSKCSRDPAGFAILANWAKIRGSLDMGWGTEVTGPLNFQGVSVGGTVFAEDLKVASVKDALNFENAKLETSMMLRHVVADQKAAESALRLTRLQLKGDLDIEACTFRGSSTSLNADGLIVDGKVLLKNNDMTGEARFESAKLNDDLVFQSGAYQNLAAAESKCLMLDGAIVAHSVSFSENTDDSRAQGVRFSGMISMRGVNIGADLMFRNANLKEAQLDLRQSAASRFVFPAAARPKELCMDGFTYKRISFRDDNHIRRPLQNVPDSGEKQILTMFLEDESTRVLDLATKGNMTFEPQPYEQMAAVMREMGHQKVSRGILINMSDSRMKYSDWQWGEWLWFRVFGRIIGYGHNPGRAFWLSMMWVSFAAWVFWRAREKGWIVNVPSEKKEAGQAVGGSEGQTFSVSDSNAADDSRFWLNALPYSVEKFIPFLSLGIAEKWQNKQLVLNGDNSGAAFIQVFTWFHIIAGWILASLWVGALTGIAK